MKLYKPTIFRMAAEEIAEHCNYSCIAIKRAFAILTAHSWSEGYCAGKVAVREFEKLFMPENCVSSSVWFENDDKHRVLSLLLMAEITRGQYFTTPHA